MVTISGWQKWVDAMNDNSMHQTRREPVRGRCTFEIKIQNSQHATWQGYIHWIDVDRKQYFRSVLEMLTLMDEALTETAGAPHTVSWTS